MLHRPSWTAIRLPECSLHHLKYLFTSATTAGSILSVMQHLVALTDTIKPKFLNLLGSLLDNKISWTREYCL